MCANYSPPPLRRSETARLYQSKKIVQRREKKYACHKTINNSVSRLREKWYFSFFVGRFQIVNYHSVMVQKTQMELGSIITFIAFKWNYNTNVSYHQSPLIHCCARMHKMFHEVKYVYDGGGDGDDDDDDDEDGGGKSKGIEIVDPFIIPHHIFVRRVPFGPCILNILDLSDTLLMQSHQAHMKIALRMISFRIDSSQIVLYRMGNRTRSLRCLSALPCRHFRLYERTKSYKRLNKTL